jgi:hypothetical protein
MTRRVLQILPAQWWDLQGWTNVNIYNVTAFCVYNNRSVYVLAKRDGQGIVLEWAVPPSPENPTSNCVNDTSTPINQITQIGIY